MRIKADWRTHLHDIRRREIALIFAGCPPRLFGRALELGAGDGFQSGLLSAYAVHLTSTDFDSAILSRPASPAVTYEVRDADAIAQEFPAGFDLVYSSNLLEHVPNPVQTLKGIRAVLADDGLTIHVIPNSFWKLSSLALYVPDRVVSVLERVTSPGGLGRLLRRLPGAAGEPAAGHAHVVANNPKTAQRPRSWLARQLLPEPHGVSATHREEFRAFALARWRRVFDEAGFDVVAILKGPVASGYGFGLEAVRNGLGRAGLTTEYVYVAAKAGRESPYSSFFRRGHPRGHALRPSVRPTAPYRNTVKRGRAAVAGAVALALAGLAPRASLPATSAAATFERPRVEVDTTPVPPRGATVRVRAGDDLQAALDLAQPGDVVELAAGATFTGPFTLPEKRGPSRGEAWITVRTSTAEGAFPPPGTRIHPEQSSLLACLQSASGAVIVAAPRAHHYRLVGLEVRPAPGVFLYQLVDLGGGASVSQDLPHHIVVDRSYLHGDPAKGARRGIALNSAHSAVVDSYLSDFKEVGADSQAIAGWNGPGPYKIANNYLEGAGENVMFGGATPAIAGLVPSDIEVRGNHLAKPLSWRPGDPAFSGVTWSVKNLFELKNARRVLVEGNLLERNWAQSQDGFAVLFTARDEGGEAPWAVVEDVTFINNRVRHAGSGVNVLGHGGTTAVTRRILVRNNLFEDIGGARWGGGGRLLQLLEGAADVVFDHNTGVQTGSLVVADGAPSPGFLFTNNVSPHNAYGIIGTGRGSGLSTIESFFPGSLIAGNVIIGGRAEMYPPGNFFPPSLEAAGLDRTLRLSGTSPYRGRALDGRDPGVDFAELSRVQALPSATVAATGGPATGGGDRSHRLWARLRGRLLDARLPRVVFWGSVLLLAYAYAGYPLLVWLWARARPRETLAGATPTVTVVIVAHDEESRVRERLENLIAQDYPRDLLDVVLASDGSADGTVERARTLEGQTVTVRAFDVRRGKPAVLNDVVAQARGDVVLLADARQRFEPGTVRALVSPFADPRVGAVSGELMITAPAGDSAAAEGVGLYWRYEKAIRQHESRVDSTVGATGAIYAIRRHLFAPLPPDTILDDVLIPLRIVRGGHRVIFEPRARAHDVATSNARQEFRRKVRTLAGNFQLFFRNPWALSPFSSRVWFQTLSHKALRLLTPLLLCAVLISNVLLLRVPLYRLLLAGQAAFYLAALARAILGGGRRRVALLSVPYVICLLSWATVVGFFRFVSGRQRVTWDRSSA